MFRGSNPSDVQGDTGPGGAYQSLRTNALTMKRDQIGVPLPPSDAPIWGILMEMTLPGDTANTATLLAIADGATSLYLSNGGGVLGGHAHESVRQANSAFLDFANRLCDHLQPATEFPVPDTGRTIFYALTDAGVLTGGALDDDLGHQRHPLSPLFYAGHAVLTQLRLISQAQA